MPKLWKVGRHYIFMTCLYLIIYFLPFYPFFLLIFITSLQSFRLILPSSINASVSTSIAYASTLLPFPFNLVNFQKKLKLKKAKGACYGREGSYMKGSCFWKCQKHIENVSISVWGKSALVGMKGITSKRSNTLVKCQGLTKQNKSNVLFFSCS